MSDNLTVEKLMDAIYPPWYYAVDEHGAVEPGEVWMFDATEHTPRFFVCDAETLEKVRERWKPEYGRLVPLKDAPRSLPPTRPFFEERWRHRRDVKGGSDDD